MRAGPVSVMSESVSASRLYLTWDAM